MIFIEVNQSIFLVSLPQSSPDLCRDSQDKSHKRKSSISLDFPVDHFQDFPWIHEVVAILDAFVESFAG